MREQTQACSQCGSDHHQEGLEEGEDHMMVEPKFNISETVEVVRTGSNAQRNAKAQPQNA